MSFRILESRMYRNSILMLDAKQEVEARERCQWAT